MTSLVSRIGAAILGLLMLAVGWFGGLHASGNYHQVVAGDYYRSGQLSAAQLSDRIARDGIRTVINLRGPQDGTPWYDAERAATAAAGVTHHDLSWRSSKAVDAAQAQQFLSILRDAPRPVLVHCEGGADRTGLATALYLAATGTPLDEAGRALSVRYGFVGIEGLRPWPMWESWQRLGKQAAALYKGTSPGAP